MCQIVDKWIKNVEKLKSDFDWEKRSELTKFIFFIVVWLLIVMTCGMLGEVFPSSQPKYEV